MLKKVIAAFALLPALSFAGPIDGVSTTLSGDPRPGNPDGIEIGISGTQDGANEDTFDFVIDFTGPMGVIHPDAKLLEFYFNLSPDDASQWVVSDVTAGWDWATPATVQGGGNNTGFLFELTDVMQPTPIPLEFTLTYLAGEITSDNFEFAPDWVSNDSALTEGQLGAHIGGLAVNDITCPQGGCSDSGFAVGDWGTSGGPDPQDVDAPANFALMALGLIALALHRRKQH